MTITAAPTKMKITFGQLRAQGARNVLVRCTDANCGHRSRLRADKWADHLRLSDIEPKLTCSVCGKVGSVLTPAPRIAAAAD